MTRHGHCGRVAAALVALASLTAVSASCASGSPHAQAKGTSSTTRAASPSSTTTSTLAPTTASNVPSSTTSAAAPSTAQASSTTVTTARATSAPLRGRTVVIDPGHDGANGAHPSEINRQVPDGVGTKACDTTGTQTNGGYTEHAFTWDVSLRLRAILQARGATVVLTRNTDDGVGPCVNERAAIGNQHPGAVGISIHADGGPTSGRGFHVIRPSGVGGANNAIVAPSTRLATAIRDAYAAGSGEPRSTYIGSGDAIVARSDLGGLNLSTIPKVFIECLNMRESTDAANARDPAFRQRTALALADGLATYFSAG